MFGRFLWARSERRAKIDHVNRPAVLEVPSMSDSYGQRHLTGSRDEVLLDAHKRHDSLVPGRAVSSIYQCWLRARVCSTGAPSKGPSERGPERAVPDVRVHCPVVDKTGFDRSTVVVVGGDGRSHSRRWFAVCVGLSHIGKWSPRLILRCVRSGRRRRH